jgi:hypothetical protein
VHVANAAQRAAVKEGVARMKGGPAKPHELKTESIASN